MIAYAVEQGKGSKYIDRIIVSTDSEKIAGVSKELGAEAPFLRPEEISTDMSTDFDAFHHALKWLEENENYVPDIVVQLRPTSPLRTSEQIDQAIELLAKHPEADSVRTVTEPEQSPYKMFSISEDGMLKPLLAIPGQGESFNLPQQKLPKAYKHVGYIDAMWRKTIMEKKQMTGTKIIPLVIENGVSGINKIEDWDLYEYLIKKGFGK